MFLASFIFYTLSLPITENNSKSVLQCLKNNIPIVLFLFIWKSIEEYAPVPTHELQCLHSKTLHTKERAHMQDATSADAEHRRENLQNLWNEKKKKSLS